jgi:hypothetical protein
VGNYGLTPLNALLENALNDLLKRARKIDENCWYFPGHFQARGKPVARRKTRWTRTRRKRDHSERLTAIGVMWRGPGVARRPAAV